MSGLAPWRSHLAHALHAHRHQPEARYLQLATVNTQQRPTNRTVVFRGFWPETNWLKFITDTRSQKFTHVQHEPYAEACWYFPKTREQFRIGGKLHIIVAASLSSNLSPSQPPDQLADITDLTAGRVQQWRELSDAARLQFAWPTPQAVRESDKLTDQALFNPPAPDAQNPPDNFCVVLLIPEQVDHLRLRGEPQNRYLYTWLPDQKSWQVQEVNP